MSLKRKQPDVTPDAAETPDVYRSEPIEDRQSTFIGYFSPTLKPKELQSLAEFAKADHKILGWRRESNQQSITQAKRFVTGSDDDGEKYGGKRIEKVLESGRAEGACVVARWYGGVMLGPVRFTHMEECAKGAIRAYQEHQGKALLKKRRLEQEEADRTRLLKVLEERDRSVEVLRKLALEKEHKHKQVTVAATADTKTADGSEKTGTDPGAKLAMDYSAMPFARLQALEKARDATLAFLLKRIDRAEAELAHGVKSDDGETSP